MIHSARSHLIDSLIIQLALINQLSILISVLPGQWPWLPPHLHTAMRNSQATFSRFPEGRERGKGKGWRQQQQPPLDGSTGPPPPPASMEDNDREKQVQFRSLRHQHHVTGSCRHHFLPAPIISAGQPAPSPSAFPPHPMRPSPLSFSKNKSIFHPNFNQSTSTP